MEKSSKFQYIHDYLTGYEAGIASQKRYLFENIVECVKDGTVSKFEAIELICKHELLPIAPWADLPAFAEESDLSDMYGRGAIVSYIDLLKYETYFYSKENTYPYVMFPKITQEEAINQTYDYILKQKVSGCKYDW